MTNNILDELKVLDFNLGPNLNCVRFIDIKKEKFELEFNLEKGTSFNTFLFIEEDLLTIIHPPEIIYFEQFIQKINYYFKDLVSS